MKLKRYVWLGLSISVMVLASCAGYQQKVTAELYDRVSTLRVVSFVPQSELSVGINISNIAMQTGHQGGALGALLGSVIDSAINNSATKRAEARAERFRIALEELDYSSGLHSAFEASIGAIDWAETVYEPRNGVELGGDRQELIRTTEEDALLILTTNYALTPQLESFEIYTLFEFYEQNKIEARNNQIEITEMKRIGSGRLKFQSELIVPRVILASPEEIEEERLRIREKYALQIEKTRDTYKKQTYMELRDKHLRKVESRLAKRVESDYLPEDGEELWLANNAARLIDTMIGGAAEQSTLLSIEMSDPYVSQYHRDNLITLPTMRIMPGSGFSSSKTRIEKSTNKAWLISHSDGRKRWRLRNGNLYSVSDNDFVRLMSASAN